MVTGDTKVVERGKADGVFITTTGVGLLREGIDCSGANALPGDAVLLSGPIGEHGMAIMSLRENLGFDAPILSDSAALHGLVARAARRGARGHAMRDPTRGGVAAALNEIAHQSKVGMQIEESAIKVPPPVDAACELLGLDPLHVANEGKLIVICAAQDAEAALAALRSHPLGRRGQPDRPDHRGPALLRSDEDPPRRAADRRLAEQRPAAEDLLMADNLPVVLIVDDEVRSLEALRRTLEEEFLVLCCGGADEAREIMEREFVQIVLCDQRMPGQSGIEFLKLVRTRWPEAVRIVLSGYTDSADIIAGINEAGIWQYLLKPWSPGQLLLTLRGAAEAWRLQRDNQRLSLELRDSPQTLRNRAAEQLHRARAAAGFERLTHAPGSPVEAACATARKLARHDLPVLITGESGTGKELLARAMHYASPRGSGPFVVENCGALPDSLLESELFGYKRGAFTGAYEDRVGLLRQADGGTIFLDEIGDTSPAFQTKMLRALQEGEVRPLGAARSVRIDVRVIAATNRSLTDEVQRGRFREDLYYRLVGATVWLPPLRARLTDLAPIANAILAQERVNFGRPTAHFSARTLELMRCYRWPGNVRELHNEILQMLALAERDELGPELLNPHVIQAPRAQSEAHDLHMLNGLDGTLKERMEQLEARVIKEILVRHRWNKSRAAAELGLSRVGLRSKLSRYGLDKTQ